MLVMKTPQIITEINANTQQRQHQKTHETKNAVN